MQPTDGAPGRVTNAAIRHSNRVVVYAHLRTAGPSSRAELVAATGLARPTIDAVVRDLLAEDLLAESIRASGSSGGRPSTLLSAPGDARTTATVHFGLSGIETVLADLHGTIIARGPAPRPSVQQAPDTIITAFAAAVLDLLALHSTAGPLGAVSVCLPGAVDHAAGTWYLPWVDGAQPIPLASGLAQILGVPVTVVNVTGASLIGSLIRERHPAESAALVYVGRGVGSAAISAGRLISGARGSAGEIGHAPVPGQQTVCHCGRRGCIETVTSVDYMKREFERLTGRPSPATLAEMEAVANPRVDSMLDEAADTLALAATWLVDVLNPSIVYLGGNPFIFGTHRFFDRFAASLVRSAYAPSASGLRIRRAPADTLSLGGTRLAAELLPPLLRPVDGVIHR